MRQRGRKVTHHPTQLAERTSLRRLPAAPAASSAAVRAVMQGNRRSNTSPERAVRRLLHARGLRYFVQRAVVAGSVRVRPDILFPRARVAVFIDGCFWHGCPDHGTRPRVNNTYWTAKLARNRARDERVNAELEKEGWLVVRAWEHEPPEYVAWQVVEAVRKKGKK